MRPPRARFPRSACRPPGGPPNPKPPLPRTPPMAAVLPDLVAEAGRDEALAEAMRTMIGEPR
ncbi:hypothetical protein, partial [Actinomadura roseirufa]|uniref:hypothetical protein n=1 Tax=Actinomadura roseirufa TaxID=2094049 RepID=UPI001A955A89